LKTYRLSLAKEQRVPPYVIFHDSTLIEMVDIKPKNLNEMQEISGVGKNKLERYGNAFLEIINNRL